MSKLIRWSARLHSAHRRAPHIEANPAAATALTAHPSRAGPDVLPAPRRVGQAGSNCRASRRARARGAAATGASPKPPRWDDPLRYVGCNFPNCICKNLHLRNRWRRRSPRGSRVPAGGDSGIGCAIGSAWRKHDRRRIGAERSTSPSAANTRALRDTGSVAPRCWRCSSACSRCRGGSAPMIRISARSSSRWERLWAHRLVLVEAVAFTARRTSALLHDLGIDTFETVQGGVASI